jgi:hypothetical protein
LKAIVHIGTEKTGTSSLQSYLYLNRQQLKNAGIHFIQSAGKFNNWMLPAFCSTDAAFNDLFKGEGIRTPEHRLLFKQKFIKKFKKEIQSLPANVHTCIISSEHFHSRIRNEQQMDNVYNFLSSYFDDIEIVCYLREQIDTCTSYYSTHLKSGGTDSLSAFFQRCKPTNYYFNYYEMLTNWERCFGLESLDISLFARDRILNGDLLDDFTAKVDASLVGALNKSVVIENESLRPFGQALARAINIAFPVSSERSEVSDMRNRCKNPVIDRLSGKGQQLGLEARKLIYESFIESNERLRQKFFPKFEVVFPPPALEAEPDYVISEDDFGTIADVLDIIRKHGKGVISMEEYTRICTAIFSSIDDVTKLGSEETQVGTKVVLGEKDAVLLSKAARYLEIRDNDAAARLMTLASLADSSLLLPKAKLQQYRSAVGKQAQAQYMLTFHTNNALSTPNESEIFSRFREWLGFQKYAAGNFLVGASTTKTINREGIVTESNKSEFDGYTIIQADSIDAAVLQAKECPILELGGFIQVSELNFDFPPRIGHHTRQN